MSLDFSEVLFCGMVTPSLIIQEIHLLNTAVVSTERFDVPFFTLEQYRKPPYSCMAVFYDFIFFRFLFSLGYYLLLWTTKVFIHTFYHATLEYDFWHSDFFYPYSL